MRLAQPWIESIAFHPSSLAVAFSPLHPRWFWSKPWACTLKDLQDLLCFDICCSDFAFSASFDRPYLLASFLFCIWQCSFLWHCVLDPQAILVQRVKSLLSSVGADFVFWLNMVQSRALNLNLHVSWLVLVSLLNCAVRFLLPTDLAHRTRVVMMSCCRNLVCKVLFGKVYSRCTTILALFDYEVLRLEALLFFIYWLFDWVELAIRQVERRYLRSLSMHLHHGFKLLVGSRFKWLEAHDTRV